MDSEFGINDFFTSNTSTLAIQIDVEGTILYSNHEYIKGSIANFLNGEDHNKLLSKLMYQTSFTIYLFVNQKNNTPIPLKFYAWFSKDSYLLIGEQCEVKNYFEEHDGTHLKNTNAILKINQEGLIIESEHPDFKLNLNLLQDIKIKSGANITTAFKHCVKHSIITGFEVNTSNNFNQSTVYRFIPQRDNDEIYIYLIIKIQDFNTSDLYSDNYFLDIIDGSVDFIYRSDNFGNFVFVNETVKKRFGFNEKSGTKINFKDWIREDYKTLVENFYLSQFTSKTETSYLEFPAVTAEGVDIWIGQNVRLVLSGSWILGIQTIARDITESKIIENELLEIQNKNQALLDTIPDSMFSFDSELTLLDKKLEQDSAIIDLNIGDQLKSSSLPNILINSIENAITECFSSNDIVRIELNSNISSTEQIYDLRVAPINENQVLVLLRNTTDAKHQQRSLQKSQEKERVALDAKQRYLSFMTHEIRTPLNAIIGLTDLIFDTNPTPKQMEYLKNIRSSSGILSKIINDVLDFNKLENKKISIDEINFDIKTIFKDVIRTCNVYSFNKPLTLSYELDSNIPSVMKGDAFKLTQVLTNLISNAIKFTQKGNVTAFAKLIESKLDKIIIEFGVSDTGIGIAEDKMDKVFNSYEQLDPSISRKFGGTGLGLTISQKFVELMGGTIQLKSTINEGSLFYFQVEFTVTGEEIKKETPNQIVDLSNYHILLVEDNEMNQLVMSKYFKKWGISYDIAENGLEALNLLEERVYDLVLLDLEMPVMDGFETATNIRKHENEDIRNTNIIALSASVFSEIEQRTKAIGFNDFIGKPINANYVYRKIAEYLIKTNPSSNFDKPDPEVKREIKDLKTITIDHSYFDLTYLEESSLNDKKYVHKMVDLFITKTPGYLDELFLLHEQRNYIDLKKLAHKFKASVAIMGIQRAEVAIHNLEINIGNEKNYDEIEDLLNTIKDSCEKASEALKEHLESNSLF